QIGIQITGQAIGAKDYSVTANFEVSNFANDWCHSHGIDIIHGEVDHYPLNIDPGKNMRFAARQSSWRFYGSEGVALFEIATRLLFIYW
ncbi:hypothetical protein PMAYCL1PPCAC_21569, partial [Pristionchus mayeri]